MSNYLEPLKSSFLTNMEFGSLMKQHLRDLATIDQTLLTDQPYSAYLQKIRDRTVYYEKELAQSRKNDETEKISRADKVRNKAIVAFSLMLKVYLLSDDPAEVVAGKSLRILYKTFKNPAKLNYEAKTLAIDKLVSELENEKYAEKVAFLNIGRYVTRMKMTNQQFEALFSGRSVTKAFAETYNMRAMRSELLADYNEFTAYILEMSNVLKTPLFVTTLAMLNTARKYYADLLARRKKTKPPIVIPANGL